MPAARSAGRWWPPAPGADYVAIILGTELLVMLLGLLPGIGGGGPALLQLAVYVTGIVLGVFRWTRYRTPGPGQRLVRVYLALALVLWALEVGRRITTGEAMSPVWVVVPLLIVLVWLRPLDGAAARWTVDALAVVLMGVIAIALVLEAANLVPSWYLLRDGLPVLEFDNSNYWLPLAGLLGLDGRWAGPFPHPNMAAPAGAVLLVIGMCRPGPLRWALYVTGALVLVLTSSRTSVVAAVAATLVTLLALLIWNRPRTLGSYAGVLAAPVAAGVVLAGSAIYKGTATAASVLPADIADRFGSLTGRTSIWPIYVRIWQESPWLGSPDARIAMAQSNGELPGWAITAHNLYLDSLVRFGVLGALIVAAALGVAAILGVLSARRGSAVAVGIVTVVLVAGVAEVLVFWRLWAVSTLLLFLGVIASLEGLDGRTGDAPAASEPRPIEPEVQPAPAPVPGTDPDPDRAPTP